MMRASSIAAKLLANIAIAAISKEGTGVSKLRMLSDTFQGYGGTYAKIAQILSYESPDSSVFDNCNTSLSVPTDNAFISAEHPFQVESGILKSGSLSQLYAARAPDGTKLAVKVQYVNLAERCAGDLNVLRLIAKLLFNIGDVANVLSEITDKLAEELDYVLEAQNQIWFATVSRVRIPCVYPELSTASVLAMEYIEGTEFSVFLRTASEADKLRIADDLCRFVFEALWRHGTLYSDTHYGNLLIDSDQNLVVLDFGCVHRIDAETMAGLRALWDDTDLAAIRKAGILDDTHTPEQEAYAVKFFNRILEPWKIPGFKFTKQWLGVTSDRDINLMSNWRIPKGVVYLNKIVYGLYHVLVELGANGIYWPTTEQV